MIFSRTSSTYITKCTGWLHLITHNDTHTHFVRLPWTADRPVAHTHTLHKHKRQTSMHQEQFFFLWISSLVLYLHCFLTRFLVFIVLPCTFAFTLKQTDIHPWRMRDFFVFSCTLFVLQPYLFLCLDCPAYTFWSVLTTRDTNTDAPGGVRTCNPSKRLAVDPCLTPVCNWNRLDSNPRSQQSSGRRPTSKASRLLGSS